MIRRMIVMLVVIGAVLGGYFYFQQFKAKMIHGFLASMANPPQTVSTVTAATQTWQPEVQAVGSGPSGENVLRRSRIAGTLAASFWWKSTLSTPARTACMA